MVDETGRERPHLVSFMATKKKSRIKAPQKTDALRASLEKAGQIQRDEGTPLQPGVTHTVVATEQGEVLVRRRFSALKEKPPLG